MEFITVEQFKEQPEEVQKVFLDWWEPSIGDLYKFNKEACKLKKTDLEQIHSIGIKSIEILSEDEDIEIFKEVSTPFLTEGQLRKFIEDSKGQIIEFDWSCGGYSIATAYRKGVYENLGEDLLQAYWKVACMIAKEGLDE